MITFNEFRTIYKILGPYYGTDIVNQMYEVRRLFDEYSEGFNNLRGMGGLRVKGISLKAFEKLCLDKEVFTIRQQNNFINQASNSFLNVTDQEKAFNDEFDGIRSNIDVIFNQLTQVINDMEMTENLTEADKVRLQEMVNSMVESIMNPVNKKIAFLTFKLVEETIKRTSLRDDTDKYLPMDSDAIAAMRRQLAENNKLRSEPKKLGALASAVNQSPYNSQKGMETTQENM